MASKVLLTSKNRVRLNGCAILDIIQYDQKPPILELQQADLRDLGRLLLGIATRNQLAHKDLQKALDLVGRSYTDRLRSVIAWLLVPPQRQEDSGDMSLSNAEYSANALLTSIADKVSDLSSPHPTKLRTLLADSDQTSRLFQRYLLIFVLHYRSSTHTIL